MAKGGKVGIVPKTALKASGLPKGKKPTFVKKTVPANVTPLQGGGSGVSTGVTAKKFVPDGRKKQ